MVTTLALICSKARVRGGRGGCKGSCKHMGCCWSKRAPMFCNSSHYPKCSPLPSPVPCLPPTLPPQAKDTIERTRNQATETVRGTRDSAAQRAQDAYDALYSKMARQHHEEDHRVGGGPGDVGANTDMLHVPRSVGSSLCMWQRQDMTSSPLYAAYLQEGRMLLQLAVGRQHMRTFSLADAYPCFNRLFVTLIIMLALLLLTCRTPAPLLARPWTQ
jgi:hypothetical protein